LESDNLSELERILKEISDTDMPKIKPEWHVSIDNIQTSSYIDRLSKLTEKLLKNDTR
jgi:hypothetical protein